ncbi:Hypothetical predicted protein [Lynx pardinus]|uniref:Murine leukemia virus integrase C-terminal domain-containing protein n=1 Tax=Lynx pardinus TaxID=191816 RepID=A0A485PBF9_LYNPA|nr:Hypothetical predicted protein [Lynx pardinus]
MITPLKQEMLVWVKERNFQPLKPPSRGPFTVILSTPSAVKVAEVRPQIHHSRVKPTSRNWECIPDLSTLCKLTIQKKQSETPEALGDCNPALVTLEADYAWQKLEESTVQWNK